MANHWWVGGGSSNTWAATVPTNWSIIGSGGAGGATVPGVADDVFFDASSGSGNSVIDADIAVKSLDCNGYTGTLTGNSGFISLTLGDASNTGGIFRLATGMTVAFDSQFIVAIGASSGSHNFTSNGKTISRLTGNGTGTPTILLKDDLVISVQINMNSCVFNAADSGGNHNVTAANITTGNSAAVTMGNGTWTITGTGANAFSIAAGAAITPGSSTIKFTNSSATDRTFAGGDHTYNNFWNAPGAGTATLTITGANTFNDFKDDGSAAHTIQTPNSTTQTVTTFSVNGNSGALVSLRSDSAGTKSTWSKASGTVNSNYLDIKDSAATGGATWNALSSTNSGNNSGWNFVATFVPQVPYTYSYGAEVAAANARSRGVPA